ncbi:MAG: serine/threonine protein kinase [Cellvibrio sp. 79]|nr:MAG: serine/threonine protein kinase [Cellvibrio sp. 79]
MTNNSPPHSANNNAPVQLGHYQLRDCIGRGGMGLVYRARDTRLERDVAIKCLRTELFEAHYIERFKREALLLAKLNHPNIVQIYDFIEAPEQVALVMELVDGQNLQLYLREHLVPITQRLQWLVQISEGLAVAHDAGIIHRDLKTENILINKRGQAKITDLGIAKSQDFNATITDHVAGSYCSMSPEQAMGETITFKSDLFSLGILAYQLLCGAHPFGDTNNKLQTMQRIISHPPTAPQKHNPDLPVEFIDLLGQLLSKDPDKRPDNTHWVAAQFAKLKELTWHDDLLSDDTQALAIPLPTNTKAVRTQDHPTFDTRFVAAAIAPKISLWQKIKSYIAANKIIAGSAAASFLIIAGILIWQLQPKPPKYVAVIPPKLTAEGMQESQQELVKSAVYDAIQQSVIQLDGYYLIPSTDINDVDGNDETILRATAADELISSTIQCKLETCLVTISRLAPETEGAQIRLRVEDSRTIDVLPDNVLAVAELVEKNVGTLYPENIESQFDIINDDEYTASLNINLKYREQGASDTLLGELDKLGNKTLELPTVQILYKDIAIDLYQETQDYKYLDKLEKKLIYRNHEKVQASILYNIFYLKIAQKNYPEALRTIEKIKALKASNSSISELMAYSSMAQHEYANAIEHYKKSLNSRISINNLFNIANAYWYSGDTQTAKKYLDKTLELSPNSHKAHGVYGIISMLEGNIPVAIKSFEKVIAQKPNDISGVSNLGLCYLLEKKYIDAERLFSKAVDLVPNYYTVQLNMADAQSLGGKTEEAAKNYNQLIESINRDKKSPETLRNLSQAYAHIGRISEALATLQTVERQDPQNIETTYTAALVHTLAGNDASAIFNIESSLKNGLHVLWFNFPWFDSLCKNQNFIKIMQDYKEHSRCSL